MTFIARFQINLPVEEYNALVDLSKKELRTARDQARFIIIQKLKELGYLPEDNKDDTPEMEE